MWPHLQYQYTHTGPSGPFVGKRGIDLDGIWYQNPKIIGQFYERFWFVKCKAVPLQVLRAPGS